jgi:hypothetical protein
VSVTVRTQTELDAALAADEATIYIESPAGVWLTLSKSESAHVVAWGSAHVVAWGSAHVQARGSAHVVASESAHVVAWGSAHVVASGSAHVVAWGSAHVEARGSAHVVAAPYVAVHIHSQHVQLSGGVVIDMTAVDESDPQTWCDLHGVNVKRGVASLFKALDGELCAGHSYTKTRYEVGKRVTAADWRDDGECGGGLHLGPTTSHATDYRGDAVRWVRVEAKVADLRPIIGGTAKCKVKSCKVVAEVDRWGVEVAS